MKNFALILTASFLTATVSALDCPKVSARSALLFDANTGRVLFKKNENEQGSVASTQKLLTALIVAQSGGLSDTVTITSSDTDVEPTKLYLRPGQKYSRIQLLTALLVKSANDVARALARDNAGSVAAFAERMNATMHRLGGEASHFVNPNGLPASGQHSSARDMARVARAVYQNPILREIIQTKYYPFRYSNGKVSTLKNTNRVLRSYSFCNGMKTGYTVSSGHCLISSASHRGRDVIAIIIGSNKSHVWEESVSLLAYGLDIPPSQMEKFRIASSD